MNEPDAQLPKQSAYLTTFDDVLAVARAFMHYLLTLAGGDDAHPLNGEGESTPTSKPWAIELDWKPETLFSWWHGRQKRESPRGLSG